MFKKKKKKKKKKKETRGDEDYKMKLNEITAMATLHRYKRGHTPRIQKGAKTSNSGVERNTIRYSISGPDYMLTHQDNDKEDNDRIEIAIRDSFFFFLLSPHFPTSVPLQHLAFRNS